MKNRSLKQTLLMAFFATIAPFANSQVQCAIDVEIQEGQAISMCQNALVPINASGGYVAYVWNGPVTGASQSIIPTASGQYIVFAEDAIGCISSDTIQVTVNPTPVDNIISSSGSTLCGGGTSTLSLSNSYTMYSWTGGVTTPTLDVSQSGTYSVSVVDDNDCVATFSFDIGFIEFDLEIVAQNACLNTTSLQASGGSSYSWSTGESSSTIVVSPDVQTIYDVTITEGSCSETLSITVDPQESQTSDFSLQDTFYVSSGETIAISGPVGFSSYEWTPGNQLNDSTLQVAVFEGTETQEITLTAVHPDGCIIQETFVVVVVAVTIPQGFSPNGDNINDFFEIPELDSYVGSLVVWNRWGDIVFESKYYKNDWRGTCETGFCFGSGHELPDGTYFYHLTIGDVEKEGFTTINR